MEQQDTEKEYQIAFEDQQGFFPHFGLFFPIFVLFLWPFLLPNFSGVCLVLSLFVKYRSRVSG